MLPLEKNITDDYDDWCPGEEHHDPYMYIIYSSCSCSKKLYENKKMLLQRLAAAAVVVVVVLVVLKE